MTIKLQAYIQEKKLEKNQQNANNKNSRNDIELLKLKVAQSK